MILKRLAAVAAAVVAPSKARVIKQVAGVVVAARVTELFFWHLR